MWEMTDDQWEIRIVGQGEVDPEELLANPLNWRIHPQVQQDALEGTISEIGWIDDIIVNQRTGYVLDGHLRVSLALKTEQMMVPVKYVDLSEDEEKLAIATLDPIAAMAGADKEMLDSLLTDIDTDNVQVERLLEEIRKDHYLDFEWTRTGDIFEQADEWQKKWKVKAGQLWGINKHRLLCGDSTKEEEISVLMGDDLAQLVFTDPPYGVDYQGGTKLREKLIGDETTGMYEPCCEMASKFSDDKAPLYLWHAGVKGVTAAVAAHDAGYDIRTVIIWNKNNAQFGALFAQYKQKHESCFYCVKRKGSPRWFGPNNEVTVWDLDRSIANEYHPTQKPVPLAIRALRNSSQRGDIVMDLFLGGGTTMVASQELGRTCYGMELEPKYVATTLERLEQLGLSPEVLSDGK